MKKTLLAMLFLASFSTLFAQVRTTRVDIGFAGFAGIAGSLSLPNFGGDNLLVDADGRALLIEQTFSITRDATQESSLTIRGFMGSGESAWERELVEYAGHIVTFRTVSGNDLLMAVQKPVFGLSDVVAIDRDGGPANGIEIKDDVKLVCLDTATGTEKWSLKVVGSLIAVKPAGDGVWYLHTAGIFGEFLEEHLSAVDADGNNLWDTVIKRQSLGG